MKQEPAPPDPRADPAGVRQGPAPPDPRADPAGEAFVGLVGLMARLRGPGGCPWDREQTHATLASHLVEETYEALEAIDHGDMGHLREELGDLLLQVVFHAQLAQEESHFDITQVIGELVAKLVRRHPHIFGEVVVGSAQDVVVNWEALKRKEKGRTSVFEGIPRNLPALALAHKLHRRMAGATGGHRASTDTIVSLAQSAAAGDRSEALIGELLFEVVALAQQAGVDAEGALRRRLMAMLESA